jgi:hypothetical protein
VRLLGVVLVDLGLTLVLAGAIGVAKPVRALGMPDQTRAAAVALAHALVAACGLLPPATERLATGGGWTRLVTETRVFAMDAATARRFAVYWRLN